MTPIRTLALRLAVLQALADRIKQVNDGTRDELLGRMNEVGAEKARAELPDGTRVASVTVAGAGKKAKAKVTDPAAFLAHVKATRPDEVVETVRDSYRRALLDQAETNGEDIPGVELVDPAPYLSCRPAKDGKDAIAAAWASGALSLPDVLALPAGGEQA